jgi:hypothetical protein
MQWCREHKSSVGRTVTDPVGMSLKALAQWNVFMAAVSFSRNRVATLYPERKTLYFPFLLTENSCGVLPKSSPHLGGQAGGRYGRYGVELELRSCLGSMGLLTISFRARHAIDRMRPLTTAGQDGFSPGWGDCNLRLRPQSSVMDGVGALSTCRKGEQLLCHPSS